MSLLPIILILFIISTNSVSTPLITKTILVTGGNKGIGRAICHLLLQNHPEVEVILGSRNKNRGETTISELLQQNHDFQGRLSLIEIDTSSDESIKTASDCMGKEDRVLYGIVNNAGVMGGGYGETLDVNYFGPRRVNDAFSKFLKRPGGRIVNIASASGPVFVENCSDKSLVSKLSDPTSNIRGGIKELDEMARSYMQKRGGGFNAYGMSKALLNAYTVIHASEEKDLVINSCSPAFIATDMTRGQGATNPPEKGAIPPVELMMSERFDGVKDGRYYGSDVVRSPLFRYRDPGDPPYDGP